MKKVTFSKVVQQFFLLQMEYIFSLIFSFTSLSESVTSRMLTTTDIPLLVVQLMELKPWIRRRENGQLQIYDNGQWRIASSAEACERGQLHPVAAHLWLLLLSLIMSPAAPRKYDLNDHRSQQLLKVNKVSHSFMLILIPFFFVKIPVAVRVK